MDGTRAIDIVSDSTGETAERVVRAALLHLGIVDSDASAGDFIPVQHQIVGFRQDLVLGHKPELLQ